MDIVEIYQCLCDGTRLRIVNLLSHGPLCVCHFQEILQIPQTKVSQHLAYLRKHGMVETTRSANWMIYSLPAKLSPALKSNLKCLRDCVEADGLFKDDLKRRGKAQAGWVAAAKKKACSC